MTVVASPRDAREASEILASSDRPFLIDFFATWCGPCQVLAPALEQYSSEHPEVGVMKVDVDRCPAMAQEYGVRAVPTLVVFRNGRLLARRTGALSSQALAQFVAQSIG